MSNKKSNPNIRFSDDLVAIDEELNAAMDLVDVTNTKVSEILVGTEGAAKPTGGGETDTEAPSESLGENTLQEGPETEPDSSD